MIRIGQSIINDYIHSSKIKNFCHDHGLKINENKAEAINSIIEYAGEDINSTQFIETKEWILNTIKEGSKDFCICRVQIEDDALEHVDEILSKIYPNCEQKDMLSYKNTEKFELVCYDFDKDSKNRIVKISLLFSRLLLEGDIDEKGNRIIYPVYIDIYVREGFIVSRSKSKSKVFKCSESDICYRENKFKTLEQSVLLLGTVIKVLRLRKVDLDGKQKFFEMAYKLYEKYSFTPVGVDEKIKKMEKLSLNFIKQVFDDLELDYRNMPKAVADIKIFLEKYISIDGNLEEVLKNDRDAYLIRISSDDDLQMTRIDTASTDREPLQCSDMFFDGKKSILNTRECRKLELCYNRKNGYLGSFLVRMSFQKGVGVIKTHYFPEESDIENVLQTVFENY